jgi:predicted DNA-binding protein with PD1-like motif
MRSQLLDTSATGLRTLVAVFDTGDKVMAGLKELAARERLDAAQLTAIGAFAEAELAYFDWEKKEYQPIPVKEQVEVAAMLGDFAVDDEGRPSLHAHLVLGRRDGAAVAGHLVEATVRPTLEAV